MRRFPTPIMAAAAATLLLLQPAAALAHAGHDHGHAHEPLKAKHPMSVTAELKRDTVSGWNLQVKPRGFEFTPARAGKSARQGKGHAHLYLDGDKIGRLYGEWIHLADFAPGQHQLTVELNADNHQAWVRGTKPVATTVHFTQPSPEADDSTTTGHVLFSGGLPLAGFLVGADLVQTSGGLRVIPWLRGSQTEIAAGDAGTDDHAHGEPDDHAHSGGSDDAHGESSGHTD